MELVRIDLEERRKNKMKSDDRIFVLEAKDGSKPLNSAGLVDPRLFKGGNKLHAKLEKYSSLWYLEYEEGKIPPPLQQKWTSFNKLYTFTNDYFDKRNIRIVEVKD